MKTLLILNDAPYGSERSYNALRLAGELSKQEGVEVKIFLIGDGTSCAKAGQKVPPGFYNIQVMLENALRRGAQVGVCGTCLDARGIAAAGLVADIHRSTLAELTAGTVCVDKVIVF